MGTCFGRGVCVICGDHETVFVVGVDDGLLVDAIGFFCSHVVEDANEHDGGRAF